MQLKTTKAAIFAALSSAAGVAESRSILPILSNVLIRQDGKKVTFTASDSEIQSSSIATVDNDGDFAITVNAKKMMDVIRSFSDGAELAIKIDAGKMQIKSGKSRFNLQTLPADDFPVVAAETGERMEIKIAASAFASLLKSVQFAAAKNDVRYYLNGVLIRTENGKITAVGTDGHRIAVDSMPVDFALTDNDYILPRKTVHELIRILGNSEEDLLISFADNNVIFAFADTVLVSKLIQGKFPDFTRVLPTGQMFKLSGFRDEILKSMNRASILANDKFKGIRLVIGNDSLKIVAANTEQEEATEEIEVNYSGDAIDTGFNVQYITDALASSQSETVTIGLKDAQSSALITFAERPNFKYVVMPMRV